MEQVPTPPSQPSSPESKEKLKPRVLSAEDKEDIRDVLKMLLGSRGFEVDFVDNGVLLIEELRKRGPGYYSFIVCDNTMPGGNGIDAIEKIRKEMKDFDGTDIIFFTGDEYEGTRANSLEKVSYIPKTDPRMFLGKVEQIKAKQTLPPEQK